MNGTETWVDRARWKRLALAALAALVLAVLFWATSRYPSLDEKAMMSGAIQLEFPLGFEALIPYDPTAPLVERVMVATVNWVDTNKKGMVFGWLFGAAFLTILGYLRRRSFQGGFANAFYGMILGAPLGVCVNCAAPIARGLFQGGSRAETTLSAMVASPTMNIVVLTMAFSLLPFYMVVTKIALSLLVILLAVPLICRFLPPEKLIFSVKQASNLPEVPQIEELPDERFVPASGGFAADYLKNLWFILRATAPLMLLAGFLGALVATLFPASLVSGREFGVVSAFVAGVAGTFAPVPIGFDVVMSGALLAGGVAHGFVMTLLFTLGSFSVYSFFIVGGTIGWRAATMLGIVVMVLGIGGGLAIDAYHDYQTRRALELLTAETTVLQVTETAPGHSGLAPSRVTKRMKQGADDWGIEIERVPFTDPVSYGDTPFTRREAWRLGVDHPVEFSFADMWPPFWEGRSVASGDLDRDGDIDLVFASTRNGLYFYRNDGTGQFSADPVSAPALSRWLIFNAALADIDNDGWLDLFLTTYQDGNFVLPNEEGRFDADALRPVRNRDDAILTLATSFADVDRDGDLDVALGNWAAGWYRRIPGEESRNRIVLNDAGRLSGNQFVDLPGIPGETLSILFSDIDVDGRQDLVVGNDFEVPDYVYFGDGTGQFDMLTYQDARIPHTTNTTMSVSAFDATNSGDVSLYFAQIAGRASGVSERLRMQPIERYCDIIERDGDREICQRNMDIKTWYRSGNSLDPSNASRCASFDEPYRSECRGMMIKDLAIQNNDPSLCALIPPNQARVRAYCDIHFQPVRPIQPVEADVALPQIMSRNVLLQPDADGVYSDIAETAGAEVGGWSWDVTMGDLDNDGWQDIYIVNGTWVPNEVTPSNIFLRNNGNGFREETAAFGLSDFAITASAVFVDLEHDGDLDIVTAPVNAPATVFLNNSASHNAIAFRLIDERGNRDGVGARLTIRHEGYGTGMQTREIQLGGGFMSFEAAIAHFGLGGASHVDSVQVDWPDGSVTHIDEPLDAGASYNIRRRAGP
ncbi:FG-GAP-like repeat-containing protein [Maricaulis sp.]|uniref:FG-GAP-like repeat-containing protein n=1 Tax=Maricaulis sp. TaxID=1486257 RepID=UPI001B188C13|nr:FG-GAP-like repeat-containing protein [Maricaulis sp.]MBO6797766.1 VCBS repeat-containing protein [Maricaulis sp.]